MDSRTKEIDQKVKEASVFVEDLKKEVSKVIVGQNYMVERLLIGLLTGGNVLLEGVPGLAKTLTVKTLSDALEADFSRVQFTPDLLPADIVGTLVFDQQKREFVPKKGPIFANLVLADEINRAPAKVQSALLEAMQEHHVTIGDTTYSLPDPFLVLATQNPIEQEGTYPLPEAQVDRFMLKLKVDYPTKTEEKEIIKRMSKEEKPSVSPIIKIEEIKKLRKLVDEIYINENLIDYIVDIIYSTRKPEEYGLEDISSYIEYGISPRGSIFLTQAARAHAFLQHRGFVFPDDIKAVSLDVLRHRLILNYEAEAEDITPETLLNEIFEKIEVP
jgi:MoxR-like ATPase